MGEELSFRGRNLCSKATLVGLEARVHCGGMAAARPRGNFAVNKPVKLDPKQKVAPALDTPTDLSQEAVDQISAAMNGVLADAFALYMKTKNFHWHVSGPHFRDYHRLFDEQAADILGSTDEIAERVRKIGGTTLRRHRPYRQAADHRRQQ